jgi:type I restriction enzyme, S subunit
MITGLKTYPAMKDSGVPWLGDVPEHWQLRRTKTLLRERVDKGHPNEPLLAATQSKGVVRKEQYENRTVLALKDLHLLKLVRVGDFVISLRSFQGGIEHAHEQGIISPAYTILYPALAGTHGYLARLFKSAPYIEQLSLYVTGIRQGQTIDYVKLGRAELPLPPSPEQAAIVRFLDHVDRRIRRYIRSKQKLIKLLEEQRQAVIHRAVTRGLDPNTRVKPSGVGWLGGVPQHWKVLPLCAIARPRKQTNQPHRELLSVYLGQGVVPFSSVDEKRTNPTSEDLSNYQVVEPGDFVLNNQQAWRGSVGVSRYPGIVSPAYLVLTLDSRLVMDFADWLLPGRAMVAQYVVSSKGVGSIQRNLYWPHLKRVAVPLPPPVEQESIARYLDDATASLATTIERAGREINLLGECRTRLIADIVTGKLDVRDAAARLPGEVEEPGPLNDDEPAVETDEARTEEGDERLEEVEA